MCEGQCVFVVFCYDENVIPNPKYKCPLFLLFI